MAEIEEAAARLRAAGWKVEPPPAVPQTEAERRQAEYAERRRALTTAGRVEIMDAPEPQPGDKPKTMG